VCALDACDRLVAVDRYSNWPQAVQKLRRSVAGWIRTSEAIAALRPDLVLMAASSHAAVRLRALGLKVVQLEPKAVPDMRRVILTLGQVLQVGGAEQLLLRSIDAGVKAAAESLPARTRHARVLRGHPAPYAAGRGSFIGELNALGLVNVIGPGWGRFRASTPNTWCAPRRTSSWPAAPACKTWRAGPAGRRWRRCAAAACARSTPPSATSWYGRARACPRPRA
jgi:iron complex transport system substrate-binding protein